MLTHISIRNFAVVRELETDFCEGMTAITGETGAGKSIAIDALGLCLGDRADAGCVRTGEQKTEISCTFSVENNSQALAILDEFEIEPEDGEIIVRRVISADGKSKAFIGGIQATLAQLKKLGAALVSIRGQNSHAEYAKPAKRLDLLDSYGDLMDQRKELGALASKVNELAERAEMYEKNLEDLRAKRELLHYQMDELRKADPKDGEYKDVEQEYARVANIDEIMNSCNDAVGSLDGDGRFSVISAISSAVRSLSKALEVDPSLQNAIDMLNEAEISVQESCGEIRDYIENLEFDPEREKYLEARISAYETLSRKYRVRPEDLKSFYDKVRAEYESGKDPENELPKIKKELEEAITDYGIKAGEISVKRRKAAQKLSDEIVSRIRELAMPKAEFSVKVEFNAGLSASSKGNDEVDFLVSINPGQAPGPVEDVASGGEMSRISLAVSEILAAKANVPTLIFDEIDTGISGQTANVVGRLLKSMGKSSQLICVTHLPQVAAKADAQMVVEKCQESSSTETSMTLLDEAGRQKEIARLLSGDEITENALASALDLLGRKD